MHKWHAGNDRDWSEMMLMSDDVMTLCKGVKRWNGDGIDNEHIHDIKMNNDDVDDEGSFWFRKKMHNRGRTSQPTMNMVV